MITTCVYSDDGTLHPSRQEWPGCFGTVDEDESLVVVELASEGVKTQYAPDEWVRYEVRRMA